LNSKSRKPKRSNEINWEIRELFSASALSSFVNEREIQSSLIEKIDDQLI
tara:strand:- start:255 stop:404 length:150 start_codon:yes stop_codon:yes gene_type:complete